MSEFFRLLKYIVLPVLRSNLTNYSKIVILSGLILASGIINQYAVSNEYYTLVKPLESDTWDIGINYGGMINGIVEVLHQEGVLNATTIDIGYIVLAALSGPLNNNIVHISKIYSVPFNGISPNGNKVDLWAVYSSEDLKYAPVLIIAGNYPETCEAIAYYVNNAELKTGSQVSLGSLNFTVKGLYLGGVRSGFLLINNEAIIVLGSNCMVENTSLSFLYVKLKNDSQDEFLNTLAYTITNQLGDRYGLNTSELYPSVRDVIYSNSIARERLFEENRLFFENEYGWNTSWGLVRLGSIIMLALYMVRVAISDVSDRMRDTIALLYSQGGLDSQIAVFLMSIAVLYLAPALLIALVIGYLYMLYVLTGFGVLPFRVLVYWAGLWPAIGVILVSLLAVIVGLATVRLKGLSEILKGG